MLAGNTSPSPTIHSQVYRPANNTLAFATNGANERMRIDSSGRLLIGHTSGNGFPQLSVSGNTAGASGAGMLFLRRGLDRATIGSNVGADLGEIDFGDLDGNIYASIQGKTDAATGSNDFPGRIILATTADGGSSPTERMRINSSGLISLATTTTANARLFVNPNVDGTTQRGITISGRKDVYDVIPLNFVHATNNSSAGSVQFTSTAAVQYVTTSDYRLKQDVVTLTDSITKLKQLNPVHFKWKDMPSVETDGFLAHEVQAIVPSAIIGEKDAVDKDGNIEPQQIDTSKLVPLLVAALQEAIGRIEVLEAK